MPKYDAIGKTYAATRRADPRIVDGLTQQLALAAGQLVADVGAGTGTYARALGDRGAKVVAVEPSAVMRAQAQDHPNVAWVAGSATALPLSSASVDSVIAVLSLHHFVELDTAFREMRRVKRAGPIVLFTFDPWLYDTFWLYDYFPILRTSAQAAYPSTARLTDLLKQTGARTVSFTEFPVPSDLADQFVASGWSRPEIYLDPITRGNMSPFTAMTPTDVSGGVARLADDLKSGQWDSRFGSLRKQRHLSVGYVFLRASD
jgi:ubiquinone/menaquinone biosynthesis C-methylase UbiE